MELKCVVKISNDSFVEGTLEGRVHGDCIVCIENHLVVHSSKNVFLSADYLKKCDDTSLDVILGRR